MSRTFDWSIPVAVRFGAGCSDALAELLAGRRAVVLAFEPATVLGVEARWREGLADRLLHWEPVPEGLASLEQAAMLAARVWPLLEAHPRAVLIGLGGGTTLDLAKLVRCRPVDGDFGRIAGALRGEAAWPELAPSPLWMVPTTAGTGSEVTRWATIWDLAAPVPQKRSFDEPFGWAERAVVDPALTLTCPGAVTRDTALDALAHALEALWNRHANPVSDALALTAARRVLASLPACLAEPANLHWRTELSLAALEAGLAFSQTRTALAHALSYAVTLEQGLAHGLACALWLPLAWRLAAGRDAALDARLAQVFNVPAADGWMPLRDWLHALGVQTDPEALGITDAEPRVAAALASARGRNFVAAA